MVRTQIYLTEDERDGLNRLAKSTGLKQSELIRRAVDQLIDQHSYQRQAEIIGKTAGMWRERSDLPAFGSVRKSWDRG